MYKRMRSRGAAAIRSSLLLYFVTGLFFIRYRHALAEETTRDSRQITLVGECVELRPLAGHWPASCRDTRYILNTCKHALLPGRV